MDTSPVYPNYKTTGEEYSYDPHLDFAQFLKEAKTHHAAAYHHKCAASSSLLDVHASKQYEKEQQLDVTTKPNKSWKTCIFTWLKAHKTSSNNSTNIQPPALKSLYIKSKTRHGYASSGPLNGIKSCTVQRTTSGPLSGLFNQRKTTEEEEEYQMPYISLDQVNGTRDGVRSSYGPVYLVT